MIAFIYESFECFRVSRVSFGWLVKEGSLGEKYRQLEWMFKLEQNNECCVEQSNRVNNE